MRARGGVGTVAEVLPSIRPMLATAAKALPPGSDSDAWTFELKWDGIRLLTYWDGAALRAETRNLRDVTHTWPELDGLGEALGDRRVVLDGEMVAFDDDGVPRFQLLQERMHVGDRRTAALKARARQASYLVFDVLHLDGRDLLGLPWTERRAALEGLGLGGPCWATTPSFPGEGATLLEAARQRRHEGIIAKRTDAAYVPGARSRSWLKVKLLQDDEFVVGGWFPGEGRRADRIGSLLLGQPTEDGGLCFVGNVGTGFTEKELQRLCARLTPLVRETSPFTSGGVPKKRSVFVEPVVVVGVEFTERTKDGILRHPSYKGERIDKTPADVETVPRG
jgi:bifunctional non-homologous end joining protein LigD